MYFLVPNRWLSSWDFEPGKGRRKESHNGIEFLVGDQHVDDYTGKNTLAATGTTDFDHFHVLSNKEEGLCTSWALLGPECGSQVRWPRGDSHTGLLRRKARWELWKWKDPRSSLLCAQPPVGVLPTHQQSTYPCILIPNDDLRDSVSIWRRDSGSDTSRSRGAKRRNAQVFKFRLLQREHPDAVGSDLSCEGWTGRAAWVPRESLLTATGRRQEGLPANGSHLSQVLWDKQPFSEWGKHEREAERDIRPQGKEGN